MLPGWDGAVLVRCRTVKHEMTILDMNRESPIEKTWNLRRRMVGYLEVLFIVSALGAFSPVEEAGKILLRVLFNPLVVSGFCGILYKVSENP